MSAFHRDSGLLLGEAGEEPILASSAENVNSVHVEIQQMLKRLNRCSVLRGEALEDQASEGGLIAGYVRDLVVTGKT